MPRPRLSQTVGCQTKLVFVRKEPKGFGFRAFKAVDKAFSASSSDVTHVQLFRSANDVAESFGSIFCKRSDHPPRTLDVQTASTPLIKENIGDLDDSFIPRGNLSEKMGFRWAPQYWQWAKIEARVDLRGKTRVVSFREFYEPADAARARLVAAVLASRDWLQRLWTSCWAWQEQDGILMLGKTKLRIFMLGKAEMRILILGKNKMGILMRGKTELRTLMLGKNKMGILMLGCGCDRSRYCGFLLAYYLSVLQGRSTLGVIGGCCAGHHRACSD